MYCENCGTQLEDGAKFCHGCGHTVGEAPPAAEEMQAALPAQPKKKKFLIPILGGVAVVAALAVLAVTLLGSPAAKLGKALARSAGAYAAAAENLELPDLSGQRDAAMEMALWLEEMPGLEEVSGLGVRMDANVSMSQRQMDMTIAPYLGAADLLSIRMKAEDENLFLSGGALTGDTFYLINTETMGADLTALGLLDSGLEGLSYNIFDLAEELDQAAADEALVQAVKDAGLTFAESVEVEKTGTQTMTVNGCELKCAGYHVTVPQAALQTLLEDLEAGYAAYNESINRAYLDAMTTMGLPEDTVAQMEAGLTAGYDGVFLDAAEYLARLGDVEADLYVSGGYLVAAVCEEEVEGSPVRVTLELGGGANYADDLCVRAEVDGEELRVTSTGSHTGDGGRFTDETVVDIIREGEVETVLTSSLSYEPQAAADNFRYNLYVASDDAALDVKGQVETAKDSIHIRLDELALTDYGEELMTLGVEYKVGPYAPGEMDTGNAVALAGLSGAELAEEMAAIEGYAGEWLYGLVEQFPALLYLFF